MARLGLALKHQGAAAQGQLGGHRGPGDAGADDHEVVVHAGHFQADQRAAVPPKKEAHRSLGGLFKSFRKDVVGTVSGRQLTETCRIARMLRKPVASGHP